MGVRKKRAYINGKMTQQGNRPELAGILYGDLGNYGAGLPWQWMLRSVHNFGVGGCKL